MSKILVIEARVVAISEIVTPIVEKKIIRSIRPVIRSRGLDIFFGSFFVVVDVVEKEIEIGKIYEKLESFLVEKVVSTLQIEWSGSLVDCS